MDGIHDLGGKQGFGPSLEERDDAVFHAAWEKRVFGIANLLLAAGCFNVDEFRHAVERVDPVAYLSEGYYGRWLGGVEQLVAEAGGSPTPAPDARQLAGREVDRPPQFAVGDAVLTRNHYRPGHTRLPAYARARRGRVEVLQGAWVLPDTHAHGRGECPEHVYAVRFEGRELWGSDAEPGTSVCIDLFESYLEPA